MSLDSTLQQRTEDGLGFEGEEATPFQRPESLVVILCAAGGQVGLGALAVSTVKELSQLWALSPP